jgi:hypothetical protein
MKIQTRIDSQIGWFTSPVQWNGHVLEAGGSIMTLVQEDMISMETAATAVPTISDNRVVRCSGPGGLGRPNTFQAPPA